MANQLRKGCGLCRLGKQSELKGPVLFRGTPGAPLVFIGEAPGKEEDKLGFPFTGPAGHLLDKMIAAMQLHQADYLITNVVKCRPIAQTGSGKQNEKPSQEELLACRPFITHELLVGKPRVVVLLGASAVTSLLPKVKFKKLGDLLHRYFTSEEFPETIFTIMYHPAYLLRQEHSPNYIELKKAAWAHLLRIKEILKENCSG